MRDLHLLEASPLGLPTITPARWASWIAIEDSPSVGKIERRKRLGGMLNYYYRNAA